MTSTSLLTDVERFMTRHAMAESTFGRRAVNDWKFVKGLRDGRRTWGETEQKVRAFMAEFAAESQRQSDGSPSSSFHPSSAGVIA